MLKRISHSHSLAEAISLKSDSCSVSNKTLRKISQRLISIKSDLPYRGYGGFALSMHNVTFSLQKIKNQDVYEKISQLVGAQCCEDAYLYGKNLLLNNRQSTPESSAYDQLMLTMICHVENKKYDTAIKDFSCLDTLFSYIQKKPVSKLMAITRMARRNDESRGHFTCIAISKSKKELKIVIYEPGFLHDSILSATDYGVYCLCQLVEEYILQKKIAFTQVKVGIVEMGIQKSTSDCAIFFVSTATKLIKNPETSENLFQCLTHCGNQITYLYETTAEHHISSLKVEKRRIALPAVFLKHSSSSTGVERESVSDEIVNKKGQMLTDRIKTHFTNNYSRSIEIKRLAYLERLANS